MVNYAVSSYLYISVPKSNTAYYTTGICKKQLLFLFFIECLEIITAKDAVVWLFLGKRLRYRKYMIKIKRKNLGTENILFPRDLAGAVPKVRVCRSNKKTYFAHPIRTHFLLSEYNSKKTAKESWRNFFF